MKMLYMCLLCAASLAMGGCHGHSRATAQVEADSTSHPIAAVVDFNADSAYAYVKAQCDMGARVPGTAAHQRCASWLESQLRSSCDSVAVQRGTVTTFDGMQHTATNLIGIINPEAQQRIMLMAHWDCRPIADADPDPSKRNQPVMGANDAASGVGVLLELARLMKGRKPGIGVDIVLVDMEDSGTSDDEASWGLGTQYWVAHKHESGYRPMMGILLDMVGASGARFGHEAFSKQFAGTWVDELWQVAAKSGYADWFVNDEGGAVTDDHVFVNRDGIPCVDVIDLRQDTGTGFFAGWHTTHDTLDVIDRATLKAVGQTVANFIYQYQQ